MTDTEVMLLGQLRAAQTRLAALEQETPAEAFLMAAAEDAVGYLQRLADGERSRGAYEVIAIGRKLHDAVQAVKAERHEALTAAQQDPRRI